MVHITITTFHSNLYANISYLLDADPFPAETLLTPPNSKSWKIHWLGRCGAQPGRACSPQLVCIMHFCRPVARRCAM